MARFGVTSAVIGAGVLVAVAGLAGCGASEGNSGSEDGDTVPIGVISSLSGAVEAYGQPFRDGAAYAVEQINSAGGFEVDGKKYTFDLIVEDDRSEQATAVQAATQLIRENQVVAIIGPVGPTQGPPVAQLANQSKIINFSAASPLSAVAGPPKNPLLFMTGGSDSSRSSATAKSIRKYVPNAERIAVLAPDDATSASVVPVLKKELGEEDLDARDFLYPPETTDLSTVLTRLVDYDPQVIVMGWPISAQQQQASQFASAGVPSSTILFSWGGSTAACPELAHGRTCIAHPLTAIDFSDPSTDTAREFVSGFLKYTKQDALPQQSQAILWSYDFPFMLADAMKKAGTVTDTEAIGDALRGGVSRDGLLGNDITFDEHNFAQFSFTVTRVDQNGDKTSERFQ